MQTRIALPKGRLQSPTSALLDKAGWQLDEYNGSGRLYHVRSGTFPDLQGKILHEKDIPVQVAIGNYDLGICSLDWIEELLARYPTSSIIKLKDLGYGRGALFVVGAAPFAVSGLVRVTSEYPNLAEAFALKKRFGRFAVFPVWGAAEAFLPESAELALISQTVESQPIPGIVPAQRVLDYSAYLIANRESWERKDLFDIVSSLGNAISPEPTPPIEMKTGRGLPVTAIGPDQVRLALPDGHQQAHTLKLLTRAGIEVKDYPSPSGNRRPAIALDGVAAKVIRPQDMPRQVANGNFDLAVTGKDWLTDHLYQFPNSPVRPLVDLGLGRVRIVAAVGQAVPGDSLADVRAWAARTDRPLRIATEYTNIADRYARDNHLGPYRVIPTWGATEAFLPDDADLLIENTETGATLARHNLKIVATLFESTACLIGSTVVAPAKQARIEKIIGLLSAAV